MDLRNKKVLVTGADGFIGSHLVESLLREGAHVVALNYYNSFNSWGWLDQVPASERLAVISGDIRDPHFCKEITKGIDVVFHLAALIAIPYSYIAPDSYVDTNVKGTLNICQASKENGVQRVIHTSTSEVYGTAKYVPIDEQHPLQPQSPYSASKIGADAMALSFYLSFNLPLVIARPFNTYGPRQSARAVIPTIISQIAAGKKEIHVGDVSPTRDFNYVEDTCEGFIALAKADEALGKTVNIASNYEVSIEQTFLTIKKLMKSDVHFITEQERLRPKDSEVFRLWGDNTRLKELTGFVPKHSLEAGLDKTIQWFLKPENLRNYKTSIYNV
jgi:NAD dependent epimerase/dehydratase